MYTFLILLTYTKCSLDVSIVELIWRLWLIGAPSEIIIKHVLNR